MSARAGNHPRACFFKNGSSLNRFKTKRGVHENEKRPPFRASAPGRFAPRSGRLHWDGRRLRLVEHQWIARLQAHLTKCAGCFDVGRGRRAALADIRLWCVPADHVRAGLVVNADTHPDALAPTWALT